MSIDPFAEIFDRLDRELWLVTARDGKRRSGLIATYVSKVSLVPQFPRVTIAIAKHHFTHELIEASGAFCMHLIGEDQIDWVWRFGIPSGRDADKFAGLETTFGANGTPILTTALAWVDCQVEARMDIGDRTVFLAEVLEAHTTQTAIPLTFKRLLALAPAEQLREMKQGMDHDVELDRASIAEWRTRRH
jgi:flavin reductase (DIM6/NTAB) family NADH-FMN oxidoreductase RutF